MADFPISIVPKKGTGVKIKVDNSYLISADKRQWMTMKRYGA
jgi:hypothetical protein